MPVEEPRYGAPLVNIKGFPIWYTLIVLALHLVLLAVPVLSTANAWTLTNVIHSAFGFVFFHWFKGTPFEAFDDDSNEGLTQWEQIDGGLQYSPKRKFLVTFPIVLFLITSLYAGHDNIHFLVNTIFMLLAVIPKLPQLHGVRLFGINKY